MGRRQPCLSRPAVEERRSPFSKAQALLACAVPFREGLLYRDRALRLKEFEPLPEKALYYHLREDRQGGSKVLFKNYMEEVVDTTLEEILSRRDDVCKCERCRMDIKALALNHLPPKYVVTDKGYVYTKVNELESQFKADVTVAVTNAMKVVRKNPRHDQE